MISLPRWSVRNPVLVGVLMITIIAGGVFSAFTLVREMFPESRPNMVLIRVLYPGASPEEVEKGLALRLEEVIQDVEGVERIDTTVGEGLCTIVVEMDNDVDDIDQAVIDIKAEVDDIPRDELPEEAEEVQVARFEPRLPVISIALSGDVPEASLKEYGETLRDDLLAIPGISDVELSGTRKAELSVEVLPEKLIEYQISLTEIAEVIRQSNLDLPGGQVKTVGHNIAVRTLGETDEADAIADTILRTTPNGQVVRVRDVGRVVDSFEDADIRGRFNNKPAVDITIYKTGTQDAIEISRLARAFVAGKTGRDELERDWLTRLRNACDIETPAQHIFAEARRTPIPAGLQLDTHSNLARYIEDRLELLQRNGTYGLILVFLSLLAFLNWRVAFWVMMGLVVSVCGALLLMQFVGATLNLMSMFGLIVVLGIIVDDAIVVGENIYARVEHGDDPEHAAIVGAEQVTWPVTVAVLTTIGAFVPLMFIEGRIGDFMGVLPIVVMCALSISLLEALALLPSHLSEALRHLPRRSRDDAAQPVSRSWLGRFRARQQHVVSTALPHHYEHLLRLATRYRYVTLAVAIGALMVARGLVFGGRVPFVFIQKMDSETLLANLEMPVGTPAEQCEAALAVIDDAIMDLKRTGELSSVYTIVGAQVSAGSDGATLATRSHIGQSIVELTPLDERERNSEQIVAELRAKTADIPGVNSLKFQAMAGGPSGAEIELEITGDSLDELASVAEQVKRTLAEYDGVFDIADDYEAGRREVQLELLDSARALNLTTRSLATEVRGAFYGLEARTIQRTREDVDIRVRFPADRRRNLCELESMRIATTSGYMVPLCEVARLVETRGYSTIHRIDQRRAVTVSADVDQSRTNAEEVIAAMQPFIANMKKTHPGVGFEFAGNKRETAKSLASLQRDFLIAVALIYVMLCGLFNSYTQPLIVLAAVPFGLTGAVAGHFLMGYPLTILSIIGIVALTGIVVNDSLILVDFINHEVSGGRSVYESVISGGRRRLRPILLTSLTTILGLAPLMMETSLQARFLIPMAISITFGLAFATLLTLVVVPAIFLIFEDVKAIRNRIWHRPELLSLAG
ncbi:MAG: efflux RND transporter permease subunit [Phycisphaerae bacterium]|nr:efflux RND transporter permease subunit [Phycisphaerae bacterium]